MKSCTECNEEKSLSEYHKHKYTKDCLQSICKECFNRRSKEYRRRTYVCKPKRTQHDRDRANMLLRARARATRKGIPFNIILEDIHIPELCPVFNKPLKTVKNPACRDFSPSLDRINPKLGYVKGNVIVVSLKANVMKNNGSLYDILLVYNFYKELYAEKG